jgi:hypothetical protein
MTPLVLKQPSSVSPNISKVQLLASSVCVDVVRGVP